MEYSSKLLESAVNELSKLPGIGRKTALRLALHLLNRDKAEVETFCNSLLKMSQEIRKCSICHNITDNDICEICANPKRDHRTMCVVQDIRDVMAIENTSQFNGVYHVLGGIISPMEGIGPNDLSIDSLVEKVKSGSAKEIIMALPATVEGDTTNFYLYKKLKGNDILITAIARGISVGDDIEFADEVTLGRSILNRTPYNTVEN